MTPETTIAPEIIYPIEDGEPLAESYEHLETIYK